jgi:hypothetical protein
MVSPLGGGSHALGDPLGHLQRGLIGKGNGGNLVRFDVAGLNEMHDLFGNHPRFARTSAGQHQ